MTIRLTGGRAGGRVLRTPVASGVRPTSARVREALFSIVGQQLDGIRWLEAFGGAGIVGLEAWSRGASVTVVERDARRVRSLKRRGAEVDAQWTVRHGDVLKLSTRLEAFDVIFADPPYALAPGPVVEALAPLVRGQLAVETDKERALPERIAGLEQVRVRVYGGTTLWVYAPT